MRPSRSIIAQAMWLGLGPLGQPRAELPRFHVLRNLGRAKAHRLDRAIAAAGGSWWVQIGGPRERAPRDRSGSRSRSRSREDDDHARAPDPDDDDSVWVRYYVHRGPSIHGWCRMSVAYYSADRATQYIHYDYEYNARQYAPSKSYFWIRMT